jgi:hypothetical protein
MIEGTDKHKVLGAFDRYRKVEITNMAYRFNGTYIREETAKARTFFIETLAFLAGMALALSIVSGVAI